MLKELKSILKLTEQRLNFQVITERSFVYEKLG